MNKMLMAAAAAVVGLAVPANAAVFSFYYQGVSADRTLTTTPVLYVGNFTTSDYITPVDGRDAYLVTAVSATRNGAPLTLLDQISFPMSLGANDNYFFADGDHLTTSGIAFGLPDGSYTNLYEDSGNYYEYAANDLAGRDFISLGLGSFQARAGADPLLPPSATPVADPVVTDAPSAVPESATWAMMIAGFGMVGAGLRRQRVSVRFA